MWSQIQMKVTNETDHDVKILNPLESHPVRQLMKWNLSPGPQIFMLWLFWEHLWDLRSNSLVHATLAWGQWIHWWWKIRNLLEFRPVRPLTTWNLCHHASFESTLETSDPTHWCMSHWVEMQQFVEVEKFEFRWNPIQWGRPWREICDPDNRFHVVTPRRAPQRPRIQLIET